MGRPRGNKGADKESASSDCIPANETADEIARKCGLYGCSVPEAEAKLGKPLRDSALLKSYENGKADHAYAIMQAIFEGGVYDRKEKLLLWLAENSLKRTPEAEATDAVFAAMSPEERREEIKRMTKKLVHE